VVELDHEQQAEEEEELEEEEERVEVEEPEEDEELEGDPPLTSAFFSSGSTQRYFYTPHPEPDSHTPLNNADRSPDSDSGVGSSCPLDSDMGRSELMRIERGGGVCVWAEEEELGLEELEQEEELELEELEQEEEEQEEELEEREVELVEEEAWRLEGDQEE